MFQTPNAALRLCGLSLMLDQQGLVGGQETTGILRINPACLNLLRQGRLRLELSFSETALATASSQITNEPFVRLRVSTNPVERQVPITLTASLVADLPRFGSVVLDTAEILIGLNPPFPRIQSLTLFPQQVMGPGDDVAVTVTLDRPSPSALPLTAFVTGLPTIVQGIPAGATSVIFRFRVPATPRLANLPVMVNVVDSSMTAILRVGPL